MNCCFIRIGAKNKPAGLQILSYFHLEKIDYSRKYVVFSLLLLPFHRKLPSAANQSVCYVSLDLNDTHTYTLNMSLQKVRRVFDFFISFFPISIPNNNVFKFKMCK